MSDLATHNNANEPAQALDRNVQLVVDHLRNPHAREALQSLVSEVLNIWLNLDLFCADGRARCKHSIQFARLQQLLLLLNTPPAGEAPEIPASPAASPSQAERLRLPQ